jgi:hypothetical protein
MWSYKTLLKQHNLGLKYKLEWIKTKFESREEERSFFHLIALSRFNLRLRTITTSEELEWGIDKNCNKVNGTRDMTFLSRDSVKRNMLAYSTLWCPNGRGLHSTPLKSFKDQTWVQQFFLVSHNISVVRNIKSWSLSRLTQVITIKTRVREGVEYAHKSTTQQQYAQI